jgi:spore coat protein U-like protein
VRAFIRIAIFSVLAGASGIVQAALSCSVSGVSLNFGNYDDSSAANTDVSTVLSVSCCRNPPGRNAILTVTIGPSTNSTAGNKILTRQMKNSGNADRMSYQLYSGSFGGTVWGDGAIGGSAWTQAISSNVNCPGSTVIPVGSAIFGRIFPQQAVSAGTYGDTVTITITP